MLLSQKRCFLYQRKRNGWKKGINVLDLSQDENGNKELSNVDAVHEDIDDIKEKQVSPPVSKKSTSITLLENSELNASTYSGQKASSVGKKKISSEDDKCNKNTGRKFLQDGHAAVSDSGVKGSAMDSKDGPSSVTRSKKMLLV